MYLVRRGGPDCGIQGDIVGLAISRAGLNVAAALAVRVSMAAAAPLAACELVQRGIETARNLELLTRLGLLAAFPPMSILVLKGVLASRLGRLGLRVFLGDLVIQGSAIFFFTSVGAFSDSSSVISA
jgi:hypothetical protein